MPQALIVTFPTQCILKSQPPAIPEVLTPPPIALAIPEPSAFRQFACIWPLCKLPLPSVTFCGPIFDAKYTRDSLLSLVVWPDLGPSVCLAEPRVRATGKGGRRRR